MLTEEILFQAVGEALDLPWPAVYDLGVGRKLTPAEADGVLSRLHKMGIHVDLPSGREEVLVQDFLICAATKWIESERRYRARSRLQELPVAEKRRIALYARQKHFGSDPDLSNLGDRVQEVMDAFSAIIFLWYGSDSRVAFDDPSQIRNVEDLVDHSRVEVPAI